MVTSGIWNTFTAFCFLGLFCFTFVHSELDAAQLDSDIASVLGCKTSPALAVSVVLDGKAVFSKGYGYSDLQKTIPTTNNTIFGIASLSKAFAATLLLKLLDRHNISLNTPVVDVLGKDFRFEDDLRTKYATLEDLLSHRLGIPSNNNIRLDTNLTRANLPKRLRYLKATGGFRNSFFYSNLMYGVITYIAERLGGKTWEELVKEEIFTPLGMTSSDFTTIKDLKSRDVAKPIAVYGENNTFPVNTEFSRRWGLLCGSGCVMSTANDMIKWMHFHLTRGLDLQGRRIMDTKVMDPMYIPRNAFAGSSYKTFVRPRLPVTTSSGVYAMGWRRGYYRGYPIITHTGSTFGYRAIMILIPDKKFGVFMVATGNDDEYLFRVSLANYVIDATLGFTPWLNASTFCSFPQPWFGRKVTKYKLPDSSTPYKKNVSTYLGFFTNKAFGNMEVYYNASLGRVVIRYGYGEWALYPIAGPPDSFYGKGMGIISVKHCHTFVFRSGKGAGDRTVKIEAMCFEMKLPPVFVREGSVNSADSMLSFRTNTLALIFAVITAYYI
ncbi:D-alanyl-D-alanine-carboxypeptidase/endopeptidase AmpH-like [Gigantopelta aegis]|uniref:D-alanyl-D-alanine- carboxypeptidase/endopeptidase AmpH-like n=1 Tax=Gigantopelta aegis TaxID=1735272 RepID=UPI001B889954|nr:D-alanyl-D-alanine-carboxypeptidase/endopeptidase AmpH-like [Gigantopelta aegis]